MKGKGHKNSPVVDALNMRPIPNVVGVKFSSRLKELRTMASALYPYRDYPEVRQELDLIAVEKDEILACEGY